jgi:hypothetical protein
VSHTIEKAEPLVEQVKEKAEPFLEKVNDSSGKDSTSRAAPPTLNSGVTVAGQKLTSRAMPLKAQRRW